MIATGDTNTFCKIQSFFLVIEDRARLHIHIDKLRKKERKQRSDFVCFTQCQIWRAHNSAWHRISTLIFVLWIEKTSTNSPDKVEAGALSQRTQHLWNLQKSCEVVLGREGVEFCSVGVLWVNLILILRFRETQLAKKVKQNKREESRTLIKDAVRKDSCIHVQWYWNKHKLA